MKLYTFLIKKLKQFDTGLDNWESTSIVCIISGDMEFFFINKCNQGTPVLI